MRIVVTGVTGFVGRPLARVLVSRGHEVRGVGGSSIAAAVVFPGLTVDVGPQLGPEADWCEIVKGNEIVVHLAARVHVMRESQADPLSEFRRTNSAGTERLARQAAEAGVKRFVYVSSIKVNGERTLDRPFRETDDPRPEDSYAISKWEAEQALMRVSEQTGMEVVIVRPPLVHGPGVKGNFLSLLRLVHSGLPLPLASVNNRRSFVALDNLVDLITTCLGHPRAAGQVFLASDGEDLSTPDLIRMIARAMGRRDPLVRFPSSLLVAIARTVGKSAICDRLCGSLMVDTTKAREVLGWRPVLSAQQGIERMTRWFIENWRDVTDLSRFPKS